MFSVNVTTKRPAFTQLLFVSLPKQSTYSAEQPNYIIATLSSGCPIASPQLAPRHIQPAIHQIRASYDLLPYQQHQAVEVHATLSELPPLVALLIIH